MALAGALRGPVRDQHGRLLDPESPEDLQQMAVTWHKQRLGEAAGRASCGVNVDAEIAELVAFEEACRSEGVCAWDGRGIGLGRMIAAVAARRSGE